MRARGYSRGISPRLLVSRSATFGPRRLAGIDGGGHRDQESATRVKGCVRLQPPAPKQGDVLKPRDFVADWLSGCAGPLLIAVRVVQR